MVSIEVVCCVWVITAMVSVLLCGMTGPGFSLW